MFELRGYFQDPSKPVRGGLAMFSHNDKFDTLEKAQAIARGWFACNRYPFIFIYDVATRKEMRVF